MKGCDDYYATIQLYLDNELIGQDFEDSRAHLEECEACRTELEAEERLSALLHRSRPLYHAPDALRERVMQAVQSFPPSTRYAHVRIRKRFTRVLARPLQSAIRRVSNWGVFVASILLVVASLLLVRGILRQSSANSYIETAVATHSSFLNGNLPLEIQSGSPSLVTAWFVNKVPFTFHLPNSSEASGDRQVYRLTGGRLINYKGEYSALVAYQMQQQKITLLVSSGNSAVAAGGEEVVASNGIVFHYSKRASLNVVTWSNNGLTYALVSSLPGSGRQSCLVCHHNIDVSDRLP
jgi:mycothiol system anti-sigma-R factor